MKDAQIQMEKLYHKYQQIPLLTKLFKESDLVPDDSDGSKAVIKLLVHVAIHKRMLVSTAIGILATNLELEQAAEIVEACVDAGLVKHVGNELTAVIEPDEDTQLQMDQYMFPPPMLVQPKPVTSNKTSGYLTIDTSVMTKKSHTNDDVCLDVINTLNSYKFKLDLNVLKFSSEYKSLSKRKQGESQEEYSKRFKQWKKFDSSTRELIDNHYTGDVSLWFTHAYDSRGRIYCRGYHLNYQGDEWRKAIVQFVPQLVKAGNEE